MSTISQNQIKLTVHVARQIVERLAPDEIELFPVYSAAFERDPGTFDGVLRNGKTEDALGFDTGQVAGLALTGLIFPIVKDIVVEAWKIQQKRASSESLVISKHDLETIRRKAYGLAQKASLPDEQAAELSDSIVELIMQRGIPLDSQKPS